MIIATVSTPSVIVDSLLGQGEALDCYNSLLQDEAVRTAKIKNDMLTQAYDIINNLPDAAQKATLYKKVMGECCDVPQGCCHCNSNNPQ